MNQNDIKAIARENGLSIPEVLALSPKNDPFYAGTPSDVIMAEWFADKIWKEAGYTNGVHLRRAHYWALSKEIPLPNGEQYQNTDKCWKFLTQAAKQARYLGLVEIESIIDNKNPKPIINANYWGEDKPFVSEVKITPYVNIIGPSPSTVQPYHIEIWCEKGTMNDVLEPLCSLYGANLCTFQGEASITSVYNAARRIEDADKPAIILYISDFDPAGKSMPCAVARKLEFMLKKYGIELHCFVKALALTEDQVRDYNLPRVPIKESEKRAAKFEDAFGSGAVELDALEALYPGVLKRMVTDEILCYYDEEAKRAYDAMYRKLNSRANKQLRKVMEAFKDDIKAMIDEASILDGDEEERTPIASEMEIPYYDAEDFLFDSEREYMDQIHHYKAHKGIGNIDDE
ncbi:MAG: hypothetical protein WC911_01605 [Thermoleophilia bacterium]